MRQGSPKSSDVPTQRRAGLQSAVAPICNRQGVGALRDAGICQGAAEYNSAIPQTATLRYGCGMPGLARLLSRIAVVLLLLTCVATFAASPDAGQAFDAANKLYEEGKFGDAATAYERLLQKGASSPALYFNWGNAQFKAGHIGRAIAAYRKAEDLAPRDPDVRANLRFARNQVQGPTFGTGWRDRLLGTLNLNEWGLFTALAFWAWLGLLVARQVRPTSKRSLRNWVFLAAFLTLILGGALGLNLYARLAAQTAIVTVSDAIVRNGPFEESPTAFVARDGAELRVLDRKDDWLQVTAGTRRVGWLPRTQVIVLPAR